MHLEKQPHPAGSIYELSNDRGVSVKVTNYGCIILSIVTPDRYGVRKNIIAGFETISEYIPNPHYFGGIIGRCTTRTSGAAINIVVTSTESVSEHRGKNTNAMERFAWRPNSTPMPSIAPNFRQL